MTQATPAIPKQRGQVFRTREGMHRMADKKPTKADLSKAGKDLRNPRTSEKRETEAAKTLRKGRKKG